jgi:hypothetical protein
MIGIRLSCNKGNDFLIMITYVLLMSPIFVIFYLNKLRCIDENHEAQDSDFGSKEKL